MTTRSTLWIDLDAAELILHLSRADYPRETGGVLAGFVSQDGMVITHASAAGPVAEQSRASFRRDGDFGQDHIDRIFEVTAGRSDYLGEWHSHPAHVGPSGMDRRAMSRISNSPAYRTPKPILVIAQRTRWRRWRLLGFWWVKGDLDPVSVRVAPVDYLPVPL